MAQKRPSKIIDLIKTHNVRLHVLQETKAQLELSTDNPNLEIEIRNIDLEIEKIQAEIAKLKKEQRQNDLITTLGVVFGIFIGLLAGLFVAVLSGNDESTGFLIMFLGALIGSGIGVTVAHRAAQAWRQRVAD